MQIMTKINDFKEIFFKSSIIFYIFAQKEQADRFAPFFISPKHLILQRFFSPTAPKFLKISTFVCKAEHSSSFRRNLNTKADDRNSDTAHRT